MAQALITVAAFLVALVFGRRDGIGIAILCALAFLSGWHVLYQIHQWRSR